MKRIGITVRTDANQYGNQCDVIEHTYLILFKKLGYCPIIIPNIENKLINFLHTLSLDGIVLSGGNDISVEYEKHLMKGDKNKINVRDINEHKVLEWAIQNQIPILGICRGMQFINLFFGGGLLKNLAESIGTNHVSTKHKVRFEDNAFGVSGNTTVNSYHNHGVTMSTLSNSLKVLAISQDSLVIEGIYHPVYPIVGIQWHPERKSNISVNDNRLIQCLFNHNLPRRAK